MRLSAPARLVMRARSLRRLALLVLAAGTVSAADSWAQDRRQEAVDESSRREAEALVNLADRAMAGDPVPRDFVLRWHHDFLKAQPGTFVPFVLTVEPTDPGTPPGGAALLYVRAARRREPGRGGAASERRRVQERYPFDAVFQADLRGRPGEPVRIERGFAVPPGRYDVYLALRERPVSGAEAGTRPRAAVLRQSIEVPDFWTGAFTTSTIMLADRIDVLPRAVSPEEALERPYAIGPNDVRVAVDRTFRRDRELVVVFVIYNPALGAEGEFDVEVDYHVYRRGVAAALAPVPPGVPPPAVGEEYVSRTNPQRFNKRLLAGRVDPAAGHPVMAGQGILLSSFDPGEYRLAITVRDLLSGKKLSREAVFRIIAGQSQPGAVESAEGRVAGPQRSSR